MFKKEIKCIHTNIILKRDIPDYYSVYSTKRDRVKDELLITCYLIPVTLIFTWFRSIASYMKNPGGF